MRLSRLPVGSSASSSRAPVDQRPGDRDPLHLAAGELVRVSRRAAREADPLEKLLGPRRRVARPSSRRGSSTFSRTVRCARRLKNWNTIADFAPPVEHELPLGKSPDVPAADQDVPAGGPVDAAQEMEERRLPAAGLAHQGEKLARRRLQIQPIESDDRFGPRVDFRDGPAGHGGRGAVDGHRWENTRGNGDRDAFAA